MRDIKNDAKGIIRSLGLVFGDIGTSPIYTLTVIMLLVKPKGEDLIPALTSIISLIIWTLIILVTLEYAILAMSFWKKGEGGTIVLRELISPLLKSGRQIALVSILTYIGISLLIGDGVITPAISILSAVEGLLLIPGLENTQQWVLILIAALIAIGLFSFQRKGTEKVAGAFGPIMLIWFSVLAISGINSIIKVPQIFMAFNPYYGINFLLNHGIAGFFVLSDVILCATGGEALYADMGHLGRKPITKAWYIVFWALVLNYLGQGAYFIQHPHSKNILFEMVYYQASILYIPFLILSIMATIIASQAMISGMFSIVYQGITTRIMPMFKVDYTSEELRSQIYIGFVNWFLLIFVILIMIDFKESSNLAAAYGLAVTGTMTLTGLMMSWIFYLRRNYIKAFFSVLVFFVDLIFLISNIYKIPHGGYWSIIIASIPLVIILIYTSGQKRLYRSLQPMPLEQFLDKYNKIYQESPKIKGSALFFARDIRRIHPYITSTMFINNIIYEDNIIVSINTVDKPFCIDAFFKETLAEGMRVFEIQVGYMEVVDVEDILKRAGIDEKVIFYGLEDISTSNPVWSVFAGIKRLTPSFVQFYKLPSQKLHFILTRLEM